MPWRARLRLAWLILKYGDVRGALIRMHLERRERTGDASQFRRHDLADPASDLTNRNVDTLKAALELMRRQTQATEKGERGHESA